MRITFSYENIPPVEIADSRLLAVVGSRDQETSVPESSLISHALDHPLGSPRVCDLTRGRHGC
jgi:hypothetical protein